MIKLIKGDCLEKMKEIESGSVDLILTDPPYGTVKNAKFLDYCGGAQWDNVLPYDLMWEQINRVLRKNGKCILFSQEPFTSNLIKSVIPNVPFSYRNIWVKDNFANALLVNKAPVNYYEDICVFSKQHDIDVSMPIRKYLQEIQEKRNVSWKDEILHKAYLSSGIAKNIKSAKTICKHKLDWNYSQIEEIKGRHYTLLNKYLKFDKTEQELKEMYDKYKNKYPSVFNLWEGKKYKSNIFEYKKDCDGFHPTQKPVALLEDLIKTYSNEGNVVLDFTFGSCSTGIACLNTNRKFIGIELDENYFNIANERIKKHVSQTKLS